MVLRSTLEAKTANENNEPIQYARKFCLCFVILHSDISALELTNYFDSIFRCGSSETRRKVS